MGKKNGRPGLREGHQRHKLEVRLHFLNQKIAGHYLPAIGPKRKQVPSRALPILRFSIPRRFLIQMNFIGSVPIPLVFSSYFTGDPVQLSLYLYRLTLNNAIDDPTK